MKKILVMVVAAISATMSVNAQVEDLRHEIGVNIPSNYPFAGSDFNTTRAGIHVDGLAKNEEIYNIFDTEKFLNRPCKVAVTNTSGLAGIAYWVQENIPGAENILKISFFEPCGLP